MNGTPIFRGLSTRRSLLFAFSVALTILVCLLLGTPAQAWTPDAQTIIAAEGAKLGPPDLFRQIKKHEREFRAGVLEPYRESDPTRHYWNEDGTGQLKYVIEREVSDAITLITEHQPFEKVAHQVGRVAYFVSMANNPLNTSASDSYEGQYFTDYAQYVESAAPRMPVIFYGLDDHLEEGQFATYLTQIFDRGRNLYPSVGSEYRRIGKLPGKQYFDDRSTAFAVTSVGYSRAISDVALVLRYLWVNAGGADKRAAPRESEGRLLKVQDTILSNPQANR